MAEARSLRGGRCLTVPSDVLFSLLDQRRWQYGLHSAFPGKLGAVVFGSPVHPARGWTEVYVRHIAGAASLVHLEHNGAGWEARDVRLLLGIP